MRSCWRANESKYNHPGKGDFCFHYNLDVGILINLKKNWYAGEFILLFNRFR